jgi:large subunit ribosomal protein L29
MKVNEIRNLTTDEIVAKIKESKQELFNLRFQQANGSLDKPSKIKELRHTVARLKTVLRERELESLKDVK